LTATVEGVRAVLAVSSERDAVGALAESVGRESGASLVLVVFLGEGPANAMVVGGSGAGAREVVGRTFSDVDGMSGLAVRTGVVVPPGGRYQASMGPVLSPEVPLHLKNGDPLAVMLLGTVEDPLGVLVRVGGNPDVSIHGVRTLVDTASLLIRQFRLRERVARDAMFDVLTGLYNRRALSARLAEVYALARRQGQPLGLIMLDADHFKSVNDLHGHPVGDRVLRALADEIRGGMRESDFAGRYGGEEFAVVLPNADVEGAVAVAERIRGRFASLALAVGATKVTVTVSAGVAVLGPGMAGPQDLVSAADAALYNAKRAGRNRVEVAGRGAGGRKGTSG
jgi:diguanylate cyclase (GGDEF)-like protein